MTNRSASKQHGLSKVKKMQPKSKLYKRANKKKASVRKAARRSLLPKK